ncbi:hypothetical protein ONE63_004688 [Megalurothrips usitatus]|uniref:Lipase domain-containing protein n=1 Tax=Megalurothrips usitatus TaxID=439358 RepID=A0AAV7X6X6_9NEOP|nr:hypothetical protein ONE63_004688 [Megalurothrips usitatus]
MVSFASKVTTTTTTTAVAAVLVLMASSVQSSPFCPHGKGDCSDVRFFLWTSRNPDEPQQVTAANLSRSHFHADDPTKMVVHGYASGMDLAELVAIRTAYQEHGAYNLLYPQYLPLVDSPCYIDAVLNVNYVGRCIADFIRGADLRRRPPAPDAAPPTSATSPEVLDLHVIGFSLGAQTAAFASKHLRPDLRLDRISAEFKCDHHRAPTYFSESILSTVGFWGWPCASVEDDQMGRCPANGDGVLAGAWADRRSRGVYALDTTSAPPFARGRWWQPTAAPTAPAAVLAA